MKNKLSTDKDVQVEDMRNYYAIQAKIYDFTRWTFLYGRETLLKKLPFSPEMSLAILEVGCGTGFNLKKLAQRYPKAHLTGLDVSADMLEQAKKNTAPFSDRVLLLEKPYDADGSYQNHFDLILFSYSLTMINPQWKDILKQVPQDLKEGGYIAVVDFHDANVGFYRKFMSNNHVRLDGHLMPILMESFSPEFGRIYQGLAGVWEYLVFIGKKKSEEPHLL